MRGSLRLALLFAGTCCASGVARAAADERTVVEAVIRNNIGWASTKDRALLESTMAQDERLFIVNPSGRSTIGWHEFTKAFAFWLDPRFVATHTELRDLRIDFSRAGDVAWWSCLLDDLATWEGRPIGWKDTRWTGVLEKRDGSWRITQMHFSFDAAPAFPKLQGPYLAQRPPGASPALFAPGLVSGGAAERDVAMSPDGKELYFGISIGEVVTILWTRWTADGWTEPEVAPFAEDARYFHLEPSLSADGNRVFFLTTRPRKGQQAKPGWANQNIFAADRRADGGWGEPYDLGPAVNGAGWQFYPSSTRDGTLYFTRADPATGRTSLVRARSSNGKYLPAEDLPEVVSRLGMPFNAFVAPDESYLIACVQGRADGEPGHARYVVFFRARDDRWSEGIPLGPEINLPGSSAISASVSPDGKYLFFAAQQVASSHGGTLHGRKLRALTELARTAQNGADDIYWVDAAVLEALRDAAR